MKTQFDEASLKSSLAQTPIKIADPPVISSHNWEQLGRSFHRGSAAAGVGMSVLGTAVLRNPLLAKDATPFLIVGGIAVPLFEAIGQFADDQAAEAKKEEQLREQTIQAELKRQEAEAEREREAQQRQEAFERELADTSESFGDRLRNGDFLRQYRDPPTQRDMDRIRGTA